MMLFHHPQYNQLISNLQMCQERKIFNTCTTVQYAVILGAYSEHQGQRSGTVDCALSAIGFPGGVHGQLWAVLLDRICGEL